MLSKQSNRTSFYASDRGQHPLAQWLLGILVTGNCIGCSSDTSESLSAMQGHVAALSGSMVKPSSELPESESGVAVEAGIPVSKTDLPSPGRTNAFELSGEFHAETPSQETGGKREVYIIGFVEVEEPSVMLAIDGRTQVLKRGDTFERITVEDIAPPRAKLSCDGVSWNASIFDRRNSTSETLARKKTN